MQQLSEHVGSVVRKTSAAEEVLSSALAEGAANKATITVEVEEEEVVAASDGGMISRNVTEMLLSKFVQIGSCWKKSTLSVWLS